MLLNYKKILWHFIPAFLTCLYNKKATQPIAFVIYILYFSATFSIKAASSLFYFFTFLNLKLYFL